MDERLNEPNIRCWPMSDFFARHGRRLIENGYGIVPISKGSKAPAIEDWQVKYVRTVERFNDLVKKYSNHGVGIVTKHTPAVDIDVRDPALVAEFTAWLHENIGPAPVRVGDAPKSLLLFVSDEPFAKITSSGWIDPEHPTKKDGKPLIQRIEVLGHGQQFVSFHIHPDTNKPYTWSEDDPLNTSTLDLTTLTRDGAIALCNHFDDLAEEAGWTRKSAGSAPTNDRPGSVEHDPLAEVPPPEETEDEINRVKDALKHLKQHVSDFDYDKWRNHIFALKWLRWECSRDLAEDYSEASEKHDAKHFNVVWKGAQKRDRSSEITIGTLFNDAKTLGWDSSRSMDAEEQAEKFDELMFELEFLDPKDPKARKRFLKGMAESGVKGGDEELLLLELKRLTKLNMTVLRKDLKAAGAPKDLKSTHAGYANALLADLTKEAGVAPVGVEGSLYVYSQPDGVWLGKISTEWEVPVAKKFDGQERCERRSDYTAIAGHGYAIAADGGENFFADAPVGLACEGRFYRVDDDGKIVKEALKSAHRQRVLSPARPIVGDMPLFTEFLRETFENNAPDEQIALLQEVFGATVLGTMARYEKAVLFKGPGRAGKGTMMKVLESTMPVEARCAVSPFKWDNEYYLANLAGKRLNVVGELPDDEAIPAAQFKTVTGRDTLTGRHPAHRPFSFRNAAAHIFNTNHYVYTKDHSDAFHSRWILLEFVNSRIGREEEIDAGLADRIIKEEMPAIMAWALQGAKRLQDRGYFLETTVHRRMMDQWRRRTSSVLEFLLDPDECRIGPVDTNQCRRSAFYDAYSQWCRMSNRKPLGKQRLYDEMETPNVARYGIRSGTEHSGIQIFRGLTIKSLDFLAFQDESDDL